MDPRSDEDKMASNELLLLNKQKALDGKYTN